MEDEREVKATVSSNEGGGDRDDGKALAGVCLNVHCAVTGVQAQRAK
jgi:hypothetical protein